MSKASHSKKAPNRNNVKPRNMKREQYLQNVIDDKRKSLLKAPDGRIRITYSRGKARYYLVDKSHPMPGLYLSPNTPSQMAILIKQLQKSYDRNVLAKAEQELQAWCQLTELFPETTIEEVYELLSPARQKYVTPIRETDEEYRRKWEAVTYKSGYFKDGSPVYITDRGERVRSKSEQLIANLLNRLNIPYRYEYPLELMVNGEKKVWRPDFLVLDVRHRREFYWEHFGRMDDDETGYPESANFKMKVYEENGLFEGRNMYYSFETRSAPLDMQYVEMKLKRILGSTRII